MDLSLPWSIVALVFLQTGGFVWWASKLTVTVARHDEQLRDHEIRLREAERQ